MVMESITGDRQSKNLGCRKYDVEAEYRVRPVQRYKIVHGSTTP